MEEGKSEKETAEALKTGEDKSEAEAIPMEESHWGMRVRPLEDEAAPLLVTTLMWKLLPPKRRQLREPGT